MPTAISMVATTETLVARVEFTIAPAPPSGLSMETTTPLAVTVLLEARAAPAPALSAAMITAARPAVFLRAAVRVSVAADSVTVVAEAPTAVVVATNQFSCSDFLRENVRRGLTSKRRSEVSFVRLGTTLIVPKTGRQRVVEKLGPQGTTSVVPKTGQRKCGFSR